VRLGEVAELLGLTLVGDGNVAVTGVAPLDAAGPGDLSFFVPGRAPEEALSATKADAVILPAGVESPLPTLVALNPLLAAARATALLRPETPPPPGVHPTAFVHPDAIVADTAHIGPHVSVGAGGRIGEGAVVRAGARIGDEAVVGDGSVVFENVVLYDRCRIGDRCRIHANTTIGADGFGYVPDETGRLFKIPQIGLVVVEDDVEIGASCTVDRAAFGVTRIGAGTKIDDQVHVGHNCDIGRHVVIAGGSGVAGSTIIRDRVMIGGHCAITDHVEIASGVMLAGQTGVNRSLTEAGVYEGPRAASRREFVAFIKAGANLEKLKKRVEALEKKE
jgi:UDP-3-O-[3-hydroxymyristoyl] glucosamine N-acyltransferase